MEVPPWEFESPLRHHFCLYRPESLQGGSGLCCFRRARTAPRAPGSAASAPDRPDGRTGPAAGASLCRKYRGHMALPPLPEGWRRCRVRQAARKPAVSALQATSREGGEGASGIAQNAPAGPERARQQEFFRNGEKTLAKGGGLAYTTARAEVVELVDTLGSGSSGGSSVGVRVSPSAPFLFV